MKKFIYKMFILFIPFTSLIFFVIWIDFFKVFGFQDYYSIQEVDINREMVTTSTFNHFREKEKFDSFIFGSSRSQAFKCINWMPYLDANSKPFHFDASGEGVWGISKKLEYIDEVGDTIKNALIILDRQGLRNTFPRKGHLFISMPCVSKSSKIEYYTEFLKASLNVKFLISYVDYTIFKDYREYMGFLINRFKHNHRVNNKNCDMWYGSDKDIETNPIGYYNKLIQKGIFYDRLDSDIIQSEVCEVTNEEINQLKNIKNIFEKHNTKYKLIISPIYDQIPMEKEQLDLLIQVFGRENICNFSGKNRFTESIHNFYEDSHFRPHVANEIMNLIYKSTSINLD